MKKSSNKQYNILSKISNELGIFCHNRALLLPGTELSLNIYEPKYLDLVEDAIEVNNRFFGVLTPVPKRRYMGTIGCLAKIVSFTEFEDNRYHVTVQGIMRFEIQKIIKSKLSYKIADVSYDDFLNDINFEKIKLIDRQHINDLVFKYIELVEGSKLELEKITSIPDLKIFSFLCNNIDFHDDDRKLLMEAKDFDELQFIIENATNMAIASSESKNAKKH